MESLLTTGGQQSTCTKTETGPPTEPVTTRAETVQYAYAPGRYERSTETTTVAGQTPVERAYGYDETTRRLATVIEAGDSPEASATYQYDAAGNVERVVSPEGSREYDHDALNQLTSVSVTDGVGTTTELYAFDHAGRRVTRTLGSTASEAVYAGDTMVAEYDDTGTPTTAYHGLGKPAAVDDLTGGGTARQHYLYGALGTVQGLSDAGGALAVGYQIDAFGRIGATFGGGENDAPAPTPSRRGFTGHWHDPSGLVHFGARSYEPRTGLFLSVDPHSGFQDKPFSLLGYQYAYGNPGRYWDPTGEMSWEDFRRIVASSGGVHQANYETMLAGSSDEQRQQIHQGQAKYLWNSAVDVVRLATLASGAQSAFGQQVINEELDRASFEVPTEEVERAGYYGAMALDIAIAIPQAGRGAYTLSRSGYGAYKAWSAGRALRGAADGLAAVGRAAAVEPRGAALLTESLSGLDRTMDALTTATRTQRAAPAELGTFGKRGSWQVFEGERWAHSAGAAGAADELTVMPRSRTMLGNAPGSVAAEAVDNAVMVGRGSPRGPPGVDAAEGVDDLALRQQPYSGRAWRDYFEQAYGAENTSSTTIAPRGVRNLGEPLSRAPSGIVYDVRGYGVFDDVAKVDLRLGGDVVAVRSRGTHFRAATRQIRDMIDAGQLSPGGFTEAQLRAIRGGQAKIPGYTWHHHQDIGRMQLVPTPIHQASGTPHFGGFEIWYGR